MHPVGTRTLSQLCDRELDRMASEAARSQTVDLGAANAHWALAERRLVDLAAALPLYSLLNVDLLSSRVGGYRFTSLLGMQLDQAWVR